MAKTTTKVDNQKDEKTIELHLNANLNPVWIDNINIGMREDNICFLRFLTTLPEGVFEQYRIMTSKDNLKKFIDALCSALNYYPSSSTENNEKRSQK